ncbi:MAG: hypothetical protein EON61_11900 [Alphaproteobacteria bacterium]|nr:MAG: hypothetical protein EON61_11900 [Alphaproteobacteria bacterium]
MALTDEKAVLILGAGVSAPFNVPLGGQMIDAIREQIRFERPSLGSGKSRGDMGNLVGQAHSSHKVFMSIPIHATVGLQPHNIDGDRFNENFNGAIRELENLAARLDGQTSETIDDFIVQNDSLSHLAKMAVAAIIFSRCYELDAFGHQVVPKSLDRRYLGHLFPADVLEERPTCNQRNWVHHLINIVRNHRRIHPSDGHKIQIVTFNYDTILEYVLDQQFANTDFEHGNWRKWIDIRHMHGACGPIEVIRGRPLNEIVREWASGIHVVNDKSDPPKEICDERESARQSIFRATQIHCAGFSFADSNVELLGLHTKRGGSMNYCNYDANVGVKMSAEKCGIGKRSSAAIESDVRPKLRVIENSNVDRRPLEVADWFKIGFAGALPG